MVEIMPERELLALPFDEGVKVLMKQYKLDNQDARALLAFLSGKTKGDVVNSGGTNQTIKE